MQNKRAFKSKWFNRIFICAVLLLIICVIGISVYLSVAEDKSDLRNDSQTIPPLDDYIAEDLIFDSPTSSIEAPSVSDDMKTIAISPSDTEGSWKTLPVKEKLIILESCFPSGKYWNHKNMQAPGDSFLCLSDTPCNHSLNGYVSCNQYQGTMRDLFPDFSGIQCFGYASLLSDLLFGTDAPISEHQDIDRIRVGDHIRFLYTEHSVIVTEVCRDKNNMVYIYVTECNSDYETCGISWGRRITQDELTNILICTRYPE